MARAVHYAIYGDHSGFCSAFGAEHRCLRPISSVTVLCVVSQWHSMVMAHGFAFFVVVVGVAGGGGGEGFPMCGAVCTPNGIIYNPVGAVLTNSCRGRHAHTSTCGASGLLYDPDATGCRDVGL